MVQRYRIGAKMQEDKSGAYVAHSDYADLTRQLSEAREMNQRQEMVYEVACQDRKQLAEQLERCHRDLHDGFLDGGLESQLTAATGRERVLVEALAKLREYLMGSSWREIKSPDEFIKAALEAI